MAKTTKKSPPKKKTATTRKKKAPTKPKTWTPAKKEATFKKILTRIEEGESVRQILQDEDLPHRDTFYKWMKEDESGAMADRYAQAASVRQDKLFDDILNIADDTKGDFYMTSDGEVRVNHVAVQRARLQIDARKWKLSKMAPEKYGDKVDVTSGSKPIQNFNLNNLSSEELAVLLKIHEKGDTDSNEEPNQS